MIRVDGSLPINLNPIEMYSTQSAIRSYLLNMWSREQISTKYRYFVETMINGDRIYLERPGRLNKGCDFVIYIENDYLYNNGNDKPPPHDYIFEDLQLKKQSLTHLEWQTLIQAINVIFQCGLYADTLQYTSTLPNVGKSYELLLKLVRWFFIEQDITYWSGKGREMLYNGILSV